MSDNLFEEVDQYFENRSKHYLDTPMKEISEDRWWEMLEVLPPEKWITLGSVEIFRMMEYMIAAMTGIYASGCKPHTEAFSERCIC